MSRHSATGATLPQLYRPAQIAEALGCSEWWVKEQARQRRIPFTRAGGAYRFTEEHYSEIIRAFEQRPLRRAESAPETVAPRQRVRRPHQPTPGAVPLRAKPPRRQERESGPSSVAA